MTTLTTTTSALVDDADTNVVVGSGATSSVKLTMPSVGADSGQKAVNTVTVIDNQSTQQVTVVDARGREITKLAGDETKALRAMTSDGYMYDVFEAPVKPDAAIADISTTGADMSQAEREAFNLVLAALRKRGVILP